MSTTTAAEDVLEIIKSPDVAQVNEGTGRGFLKVILIAVGVAVIAAAVAAVLSRRGD